VKVLAVTFAVLLVAIPAFAQSPLAHPSVRLEKTRFSLTETVFFWINVSLDGPYPKGVQNRGRVIITRPDGTQKIDTVGLPLDGFTEPTSFGGGWGLGQEKSQPGKYTVVYEFLGQQSAPVSFTVESLPELDKIVGEFVFPSPLEFGTPGLVTLVVRNGTSETIRFPQRGQTIGDVTVTLNKVSEPKFNSSYFVPDTVLQSASGAQRSRLVPTVTLAPGATYQLELKLADTVAGQKIVPGEYDLKLGTTLQILIGEPGGPFASVSPLRLKVESSAHGSMR
jgi:hypothetical protein